MEENKKEQANEDPKTDQPSEPKKEGEETSEQKNPEEEEQQKEETTEDKMVDMIKQSDKDKNTQKLDDGSERILILTEKSEEEDVISLWALDTYFHSKYHKVPAIFRYIAEILVVGLCLFTVPLLCIYFTGDDAEISKLYDRSTNTSTKWQMLFKADVYFLTWYICDILLYIMMEGFIHAVGLILGLLRLYQSELCWRVAQSAYMQRSYFKNSLSSLFAFHLADIMYVSYHRPGKGNYNPALVAETILLWLGVYYAMLFIVKFLLNIFTFNMKQSVYRDTIIDINSKSFIFSKLKAIGDKMSEYGDYDYVIDNMDPDYDTGLGLISLSFCDTEENMKDTAKKILKSLGKESLTYDDIKRFFPKCPDKVYTYFTDTDSKEDPNKVIEEAQFVSLATEVYRNRLDMAKSLRDRDSIYDKLDIIFSLIVTYLAIIILMMLFQADYKVFMASFGTSMLTFSWIFSDSIKAIYNCFIFLLIVRPYGIGDRVIVEKEVLVVYKIDLFTTTFLSLDKKVVYIPNTKLITCDIANLARSPPQNDLLEIVVDGTTTYVEAVALQTIANEMLLKENQMFTGCELEKLAGGVASFRISHTRNFQNFMSLHTRRDMSIKIFRNAMKKAGITFTESYTFV